MNISKKASLFLLAVTAIAFSRTMFLFFNDPEGPNLLVVIGMAVILYVPSLALFLPKSQSAGFEKLLWPVIVQAALAVGFYFFLG